MRCPRRIRNRETRIQTRKTPSGLHKYYYQDEAEISINKGNSVFLVPKGKIQRLVGDRFRGHKHNGAGDRTTEKTETPTMKRVGRNLVLGTDTVVIPLVYDAGGRLVSRASDTFTFDADGNQVKAVENGDETRYTWSNDNRLMATEKDIECQRHGKRKCRQCPKFFTVSESYGYVPESWKRITRKTGDDTFVSLYDGDDESHEYTLETYKERDRKGKCEEKTKLKLIREFIGGPGTDDLVSTKYHGRTLEFLKDGLGSTIALTNKGGNTVAKIGYDAFGNMRWPDKPGHGVQPCREDELDDYLERFENGRGFENTGFDPCWLGRHHAKVMTPYLFTGRRFDGFSQTYNNRNRQYSPKYGRFLSSDPIGFNGGNNLWRYCNNNPVSYIDPDGLFKVLIWESWKRFGYKYSIISLNGEPVEIGSEGKQGGSGGVDRGHKSSGPAPIVQKGHSLYIGLSELEISYWQMSMN